MPSPASYLSPPFHILPVALHCRHLTLFVVGGDVNAANAWIYKNGLPDVTCQQYQAKNMECSAINTCMNCDHDPEVGCSAVKNYPMITLSEFGTAHGDDEIMAEIYARGPVSSNIDANCLAEYKGGINMYDTCNTVLVNHVIELNGWGTEVRRRASWLRDICTDVGADVLN